MRINEIMPLLLSELPEEETCIQGCDINDILRCFLRFGTNIKGLAVSTPQDYIKQNVLALKECPALIFTWIFTICIGFLMAGAIAKSLGPKDIN